MEAWSRNISCNRWHPALRIFCKVTATLAFLVLSALLEPHHKGCETVQFARFQDDCAISDLNRVRETFLFSLSVIVLGSIWCIERLEFIFINLEREIGK